MGKNNEKITPTGIDLIRVEAGKTEDGKLAPIFYVQFSELEPYGLGDDAMLDIVHQLEKKVKERILEAI